MKKQKMKMKRELIENYEMEQTDSGQMVMADSTSKCKFTKSFHKNIL